MTTKSGKALKWTHQENTVITNFNESITDQKTTMERTEIHLFSLTNTQVKNQILLLELHNTESPVTLQCQL